MKSYKFDVKHFPNTFDIVLRIVGSVVEFSPATRETGVRFPDNALVFPCFTRKIIEKLNGQCGGRTHDIRVISTTL